MKYNELPAACFSRYAYNHEQACCYRAEVLYAYNKAIAVQWYEKIPPHAVNPTLIKNIDYNCGWCLCPFLIGSEIYPFCPGDILLVLDNGNSNIGERFLIIGFDEELYTGSWPPVSPCIPGNLGFHYINTKYSAPFYTTVIDDNGQTQCTSINPFIDYGDITIPRGTLTNTGDFISIATLPGQLTALKSFQTPNYNQLVSLLSIFSVQSHPSNINVLADGSLLTLAACTLFLEHLTVSATRICLRTNTTLYQNTASYNGYDSSIFPFSSMSSTGAYTALPGGGVQWAENTPNDNNYADSTTLPPIVGNEGSVCYNCIYTPNQSRIVAKPTFDSTGVETYTISTTPKTLGSFHASGDSWQPLLDAYGSSVLYFSEFNVNPHDNGTYTRNYNMSGSVQLFDNGTGFTGTMSIVANGSASEVNVDGYVPGVGGSSTSTCAMTDTFTATYMIGSCQLQHIKNSMSNFVDTIRFDPGGTYWPMTVAGTASTYETNFAVLAMSRKGDIIVYITQTISSNGSFSGRVDGIGDETNVATYSGEISLVLWTPRGSIVLERGTPNFGTGVGLPGFNFTGMPLSSNTFFDIGPNNISMPQDSNYSSFVGQTYSLGSHYVPYTDNMSNIPSAKTYISRPFNQGGYYYVPVVNLWTAPDERQTQISYMTYGVQKTRYFVDHVEWLLPDIINR